MTEPKWDPFASKLQKTQAEDDQFTKVAIIYILGVGVGFTLVCFGFIFFLLALLAGASQRPPTPAWVWYLSCVLSEIIGSLMIYLTLKGSPEPGTFPTK